MPGKKKKASFSITRRVNGKGRRAALIVPLRSQTLRDKKKGKGGNQLTPLFLTEGRGKPNETKKKGSLRQIPFPFSVPPRERREKGFVSPQGLFVAGERPEGKEKKGARISAVSRIKDRLRKRGKDAPAWMLLRSGASGRGGRGKLGRW